MNLCVILRSIALLRAFGASFAAFALLANSSVANPGPDTSRVFVTIVFPAGAMTEPACDAPPRLIEFTPIELPPKIAASIKSGTGGPFHASVDEQGIVRDIVFTDTARYRAVAQPIRSALLTWKFEPVICHGEVKAVTIPLAYIVNRPAGPTDVVSRGTEPPIPMYRIEPTHVPALTRRALSSRQPYLQHLNARAQITQVPERGPDGTTRVVTKMIQLNEQPRVEFPEVHPPSLEPWWSASVTLIYEVDAGGTVHNLAVLQSSCRNFEPEAAAAVRAWRFQPSMVEGKPARSLVRDTVVLAIPKGAQPPQFSRRLDKKRADARWGTSPQFARLSLPVYPTELARKRTKGEARAEVHLDETGRFLAIEVTEATNDAFGHALRAALLDSSFEPARTGGKPSRAAFAIEARFTPEPENMPTDEPRLPAVHLEYPTDAPLTPSSMLDRIPKLLVGRPLTLDARLCPHNASDTAVVEITVDPTGRVKDPSVVSASQPQLGYVAVQTVASWLFEEPTRDGRHVATRIRVPFTFGSAPSENVPSAANPSR